MLDPSLFGPITFALSSGIGQFSTFLPNFREIRQADPANNPELVTDVRMGEVAAVLVTLGVGATASALTRSSAPTVAAGLTSVALILLYETALRSGATTAPTEVADNG